MNRANRPRTLYMAFITVKPAIRQTRAASWTWRPSQLRNRKIIRACFPVLEAAAYWFSKDWHPFFEKGIKGKIHIRVSNLMNRTQIKNWLEAHLKSKQDMEELNLPDGEVTEVQVEPWTR